MTIDITSKRLCRIRLSGLLYTCRYRRYENKMIKISNHTLVLNQYYYMYMYIIHTHYYIYMYIHMYTFTSVCTHIQPLVVHVHIQYTQPIVLCTCTCMYIIIPTHWIYLYIIHREYCANLQKLSFLWQTLWLIHFGEYCKFVPETLRPIFCLFFHSTDAKSE